MSNWYTVKVKYNKEYTDGTIKRVSEPYLVNALSFTDAEARIYKEVAEYTRGEFLVTSIAQTNFDDIFHFDDAEKWYKAKITSIAEDADNGKEKRINSNYLVSAHNVKEAYERLEDSLKGLMFTYEIPTIGLTPLVEIFPYEAPEQIEDAKPVTAQSISEEEDEFDENNSPRINVAYSFEEEE